MNTNGEHKTKVWVFLVMILIGLFLLVNTNNNPNPIVQRIFRPIHIGNGTLYYAALIPLLIIYYSLKGIYKEKNYSLLDTTLKRIVILVVLVHILPSFSQSIIRVYKGFSSNLNSIYCYRDNMSMSVGTTDNIAEITCKIELQNCSSETKEFKVKVKLPNYVEDIKESILTNENVLVLDPKERRRFEIKYEVYRESDLLDVSNKSVGYIGLSDFEFSIYNELQEVKFVQSD